MKCRKKGQQKTFLLRQATTEPCGERNNNNKKEAAINHPSPPTPTRAIKQLEVVYSTYISSYPEVEAACVSNCVTC